MGRPSNTDRVGRFLRALPQKSATTARLVVLCYHSVHPSASFPTRTSPGLFEEHIRWLRKACELVTFSEVARGVDVADRTRPTVAVTFDDGYADNFTHAFPILARFQIPATFFVATGLIERDPDVLAARSWLGWREPGSTMTWDQLREMRDAGMTIGSHGHLHVAPSHLHDGELIVDLERSKQTLENQLGEPVTTLAYPKGRPRRDVLARSVEAATNVGYKAGAAILLRGVRPSDGPMLIPRFPIAQDDLDTLRAKVSGRLDLIGAAQEHAPLSLLRLVST